MKKKEKQKFYNAEELHLEWMKNPKYRREYEKLEPEFQIARAIIDARINKKLTQKEIAKRAKTGQAVISRLENMTAKPSLSLLQRVAEALNARLEIRILPK